MPEVKPEAKPERKAGGLRNVVAGESGISSIDGQRGVLAYRGIDIHALAERSTFEEVVFLLHRGVLPTRAQLDELQKTLARERPVPEAVVETKLLVPHPHRELVPRVVEPLLEQGADIPVVVGGIIPDADAEALRAAGVAAVYTPKDFELTRILRDVVSLVAERNGIATAA